MSFTALEKYAKSYTERAGAIKVQQALIGQDPLGRKMIAAQMHAQAGTKGVDYRAGLGAEGFDKVISEQFGEDVTKRIQQRRQMLMTGEVGGKKLTVQQRQQVAAAQQREVQGLYQRGEGMAEGGRRLGDYDYCLNIRNWVIIMSSMIGGHVPERMRCPDHHVAERFLTFPVPSLLPGSSSSSSRSSSACGT